MSDSRRKRSSFPLRTRTENGDGSQRNHSGSQTHHRGRNNNAHSSNHRDAHRMSTTDRVKKIVQEEGRTARNLVIYHVPVQDQPTQTDRSAERSRHRQAKKSISKDSKDGSDGKGQKSLADLTKSPKSDSGKKPDLRARYWKFLFDNLQRAVDAIYETCEQDESALECKEVIMMLQQSTRDFQSLIERLHVQKEFEIAAKDGDRPASIAWEIRKMSPGKSPSGLPKGHHTSPSPAQRVLNFSYPLEQKPVKPGSNQLPVGNSWADRVKGISCSPGSPAAESSRETTPNKEHPVLPEPPVLSPVPSSLTESDSYKETNDSDDSDGPGWEMVHRGGKFKSHGSPSQRSLENLPVAAQSDHYKLTRSISDPNAGLPKQWKKNMNTRGKGRLSGYPGKGRSVTSSIEEIPSQNGARPRIDSKGSEKENVPATKTVQKSHTDGTAASERTETSSPQLKAKSRTDRGSRVQNKGGTSATKSSVSGGKEQTKSKPSYAKVSSAGASYPSVTQKVKHSPVKGESKTNSPTNTSDRSSPGSEKAEKASVGSEKSEKISAASRKSEKKAKSDKAEKPAEIEVEIKGGNCDNDLEKVEACDTKTDNKEEVKGDTDDSLENTTAEQGCEDESEQQLEDALASVMDEEDSLTVELEKEQEKALESAIQEEESWLKELAREENTVIEIETENDESDLGNTMSSLETSTPSALDWDTMVAMYDAEESSGKKKDWGEMVEEAEIRTPGHAVHMHNKLSSPSRKRLADISPSESKKRHEEKQAKAQELRDKLMAEKSDRLRELGKKVEEVRAWKEELMRQKKDMIERKMQQAEEKRQVMLKSKALKAHDEEAKANEIAFINSLEAQNKRLDIMVKHQESEARLQDIQDERQRKHEEKLAKEAAVEERRKTLQADRLARLHMIQERRMKKNARIEQVMQEKETERQEALRAKEKDREERLAALNAQHEQHIQELQKKIQQKQDESSQRHMEVLKQIKEKAFEMSVLRHSTEDHNDAPQITPYAKQKMCTICNTLIPSEVYLLSHLRGKTHQQALKHNNNGQSMTKQEIESFNLKHIVNAPDNTTHPKIVSEKERIKSLKKRCKKLKQRMNARGLEYENGLQGKQPQIESENKAKIQKVIRDINKYLQSQESGPWAQSRVSALDRALGELNRIFEKKLPSDQASFRHLGGLTTMCRIVQLVDIASIQTPPCIPQKSLVLMCQVFRQACKSCYDNCHYMMFSNKIGPIIELTIHQLTLMLPTDQQTEGEPPKLPFNNLALHLLQLLTCILTCLAKNSPSTKCSEASIERMSNTVDAFTSRGNDIISFIISVGIVDKLTQYLRLVQGSIDGEKEAAEFIQHSLALLVGLTKFHSIRKSSIFERKRCEDPTQLISTFEVTELVGIVSLLYGMLLHSGTPGRGDTAPPEFPQHTLAVATTGLRMLNYMATLDLEMMQSTLGQEGTSLEFRHIASYLIWYCTHHMAEELLHEVILCVGYFTVKHLDNQVVIQSGQPPTVLQQLCSLSFAYFSDPRLVNILFPTLISCCYSNQANREILEQELSCVLLSNFIEEKLLESQQASLQMATSTPTSSTKKGADKEKRGEKEGEVRITLGARFPTECWTAAQEYFKVT